MCTTCSDNTFHEVTTRVGIQTTHEVIDYVHKYYIAKQSAVITKVSHFKTLVLIIHSSDFAFTISIVNALYIEVITYVRTIECLRHFEGITKTDMTSINTVDTVS